MYQKGVELSTYPPQETGCLTRLVPGAWNSPLSTTVQVVLAGRKAGQRNKGGSSSGGRHDAHSEGQVVCCTDLPPGDIADPLEKQLEGVAHFERGSYPIT